MWVASGATGLVTGAAVFAIVAFSGVVVDATPAVAADASSTSSAVTLTSAEYALDPETAPMPDLAVTVSQTTDLVSQGIVISWTGGKQSARPIAGSMGGENFLQIAQCWGEDPDHPGHPDRTTCQYGASNSEGTTRNNAVNESDVAPEDAAYTVPRAGIFTPPYTSIPFRAVDGDAVADVVTDPATGQPSRVPGVDVNNNRFFTALTTNEVRWAGSGRGGQGSVAFEVQTAMQSPALGCGAPIVNGDSVTGQSCWLVVIPRGQGDSGSPNITRSGLFWDAWEHHLAFKLDFKPLGVRCEIGEAEKQLAGSELIAGAIASWQPGLCLGEEGSAFVLSTGPENDALAAAAQVGPSPLAFTSRPLASDEPDPLVYAPIALSSVAISFAIERQVSPVGNVPEDVKDRNGLPFESLNLTPRLVAKLLTASYLDSLPNADKSHLGYRSFDEPGHNARTITQDPDFLAVNDAEWKYQLMVSPSIADLLMPTGRSDLAWQLWRYVLSDAEARAFLDGEPDPWGMKVNPWFSTSDAVNPTGAGMQVPRDNFPKADPIEKPDTTGTDPANGTGPVNLVTWRPYTTDFENGAYLALRGDGQILGEWNRFSVPPKYGKQLRDLVGNRKVMSVTTAPAAARYQTVTASLRNAAGEFVAPTEAGMLAAAAAMNPTAQRQVLEYDPAGEAAKAAPTAYPMTMPVYAALNPRQDDPALRAVYGNLIRYAVVEGQNPGTDIGELPPGYAPIPQSWHDQALLAASSIEQGISPLDTPPPAQSAPASGVGGTPTPVGVSPGGSSPAVPNAVDPSPSGQAAAPLSGAATPDDPDIGAIGSAVPAGVLTGLGAAAAVPLLGRLRRRL